MTLSDLQRPFPHRFVEKIHEHKFGGDKNGKSVTGMVNGVGDRDSGNGDKNYGDVDKIVDRVIFQL